MAAEVRLRIGQYRKFCRMRGWDSENQQAHALGVSPSTVNRILKGTQKPSSEFIGAALTAFPELEFSDLFEVINETPAPPLASAGYATFAVVSSVVLFLELVLLLGVVAAGSR